MRLYIKSTKFLIRYLVICFVIFFIAVPNVSAQLADSPWPVFHGDYKLTGQSQYDTSHVDGTVKWKFKAESQIETSPVIGTDGTIYIGDHSCNLYAVNSDGTEKWRFSAGEPVTSKECGGKSCLQLSPAVAFDGTIYILPMSGNFYAVNPDGTEKWRYPIFTFKNAWPSPAIGPDGTIYVGSEAYPPSEANLPQEKGAHFYALNPDGSLKWSHDTNSVWVNGTASVADDGTTYISGGDFDNDLGNFVNTVFAFNSDGTLKWKFRPRDGVLEGSIVIGKDGTLYFDAKGASDPREANFYALTPEGKIKWQVPINQGISITPGIANDGTIYFGDWGGVFYAFDENGKELWRVQTPQSYESLSSSPAIGADGTIYFGSISNYFYAYTPDGQEKWKVEVEFGGVISSPAIGADGTIYFASVPGELWAIGGSTGGVLASLNGRINFVTGGDNNMGSRSSVFLLIAFSTIFLLGLLIVLFLVRNKKIIEIFPAVDIFFTKYKLVVVVPYIILLSFFIASVVIIKFENNNQKYPNNSVTENIIWQKGDQSQDNYKSGDGQVLDRTHVCPRRVYGTELNGYYGVFEMDQVDLLPDDIGWIKENCPDTIWPESMAIGYRGDTYTFNKTADEEFEKDAFLAPGGFEIYARYFGEINRSCLDANCVDNKTACVQWNKYKDQCYRIGTVCELADCQKYKIYCELIIVNQDEESVNIKFDSNYITKDDVGHLVGKQSFRVDPGKGSAVVWEYDVSAGDIGECDYKNLVVQ